MITRNTLDANAVPPHHRAHRNNFVQWLGRFILKILGWKIVGEVHELRKFLICGAPHTSNWDFILAMAGIMALDLDIHWIGKHTIFKQPFRAMFVSLGGIPLDRSRPEGVVEQTAAVIRDSDKMVIGMMPEGTRNKVDKFKTGFLRIARAADCPVAMAALDYQNKCVVIGELIQARDDFEAQAAEVKALYGEFIPRHPEKF